MTDAQSPPFISIEGIHNFRDLGGYPISTSPVQPSAFVRRNCVYRSAEPSKITAAGAQDLQSLGITTIFDMRSTTEIEKYKAHSTTYIKGVERVHVPVFGDEIDASPEKLALRYKNYASSGTEGFVKAYGDILEMAGPSYGRVFSHLRDKPSQPCLIHCSAGKDRTGVLAALILGVAGVDQDEIAQEYALTETGLAGWKSTIVEALMKEPALQGNREGVLNMVSAKAENMIATLRLVDELYGGAEGYLVKKCSFTEHDIDQIRQNLTEAGVS